MSIRERAQEALERRYQDDEGIEKVALLRAGMVMGGSLAAAAAIAGAGALHERITRKRDFQDALSESPTAKRNSKRAFKHFMTLRRINQQLSSDPLVAAGYMNKAMSYESEGIDPSLALSLAHPGEKMDRGSVSGNTLKAASVIGKLVD